MINPKLLTLSSYNKYKLFPNDSYSINHKLQKLLHKMYTAFIKPIQLEFMNPTDIDVIKNIFYKFNNEFNVCESKFINDVDKMKYHFSCYLIVPKGIITLNFLVKNHDTEFIARILHATHTFCNYFKKYDYSDLIINICLDDNHRVISDPSGGSSQKGSFSEKIHDIRKKSLAFNVSGVTYKHKKIINLTRKEEIIKLLFHEMIHYIELDDALMDVNFTKHWSVKKTLNLSEAYTEFLAVVLNAAYQAIQLGLKLGISIEKIYVHIIQKEINHSIFLTANILKFYGYNKETYPLFFTKDKINVSPIQLWEYVFLRTMLIIHLNKVIDMIPDNYQITNPTIIINLLNNDNDLINNIYPYMEQPMNPNVSYNAVDIDWSKF